MSNSIIVYCKQLTHARTNGRTHTHACTRVHTRAHAHARTPAHPHTHTHRRRCIAIRFQPTVTARSAGNNSGSLAFEINSGTGGQVSSEIWKFFAYKKLLGRTETRTRDRMYLGRIRYVRDISRDDRARIATCILRTPTDRLMENYSRPYRFATTFRC